MPCGIDFGTSNSTVGIIGAGRPFLVPVEGEKTTIPSAIFIDFATAMPVYGRAAVQAYLDGTSGRLMRALKSVLGSTLALETTQVGRKAVAFTDVIAGFVGHLKAQAEAAAGGEVRQVVLGRPVHFVDGNPAQDRAAQDQLKRAAHSQGFADVAFEFEPIAAALAYEQTVTAERLVLIADIGGGTADFSVVRVGPEQARQADRSADILANGGVHVGGTDFDRLLSLAEVLPALGCGTPLRNGKQNMPAGYYHDLATWHRINKLYGRTVPAELRQLQHEATRPEAVGHLLTVVEQRLGHALATEVENGKVKLSDDETHTFNLPPLPLNWHLTRAALNAAIAPAVARMGAEALATLQLAGLRGDDVHDVFFTGGSSQVPLLQQELIKLLPRAEVKWGDMFGSVGLGLALAAERRFGGQS